VLLATVTDVADVLFVTTAWFGKGLAGLAFLKVFTAFANKEHNVVNNVPDSRDQCMYETTYTVTITYS